MMKTYEFKSERNWNKIYDMLDYPIYSFCSYGYLAITVFDEETDEQLKLLCKLHRVAIKEI